MADNKPEVAVIMGSASDWETMKHACEMLDQFEVPYMKQVISAHRTPELMGEFAHNARANGLKVIIAGAGGAAHLPGMVAAQTTLPVIGVPVRSHALSGWDSLLSIVQMPGGIPVATTAVGNSGATNAGLLAVSILSTTDERLAKALQDYRDSLKEKVAESNASLSEETNGRIERLMPGATIGIIGGGQLGRMMALSARYMGFRIGVLDPTSDCPAAQVADFQVTAEYDDIAAIRELAEKSDVLTYEFENVDADAIDQVRSLAAAPQGTDLLRVTQDRVNEKRFINDHGTPTAPWKAVNSVEELEAALDEIHYPAVLKTRSGGYDGHGQTVLKSEADLEQVRARADHDGSFPPSILEGFVDFAFEASILVAGNGKNYVTFPIVRNEHRNNILHMTIAPAEVDETVAKEAHELALRLAKGFELAGILAIELFITKDNKVIVNELAPRPHNSGHYTIEACSFDQFDAHIRGIAGWPLEQPQLLKPAVMVNVLGQHVAPTRALIADHPEWNVHDYCKAEVRHDRKMGHITVLTDDTAKTVADLEATGCWDDLKKA